MDPGPDQLLDRGEFEPVFLAPRVEADVKRALRKPGHGFDPVARDDIPDGWSEAVREEWFPNGYAGVVDPV